MSRALTTARGDPTGCRDVKEDCETTVGLGSWGSNELHVDRLHPLVGSVEILDSEKEADAASDLRTSCPCRAP